MTVRSSLAFLALSAALAGGARAQEDDTALQSRLEAQAKAYKVTFPEQLPFDPAQWSTSEDYPLIGDPKAKKGGMLTGAIEDPLPTLRAEGPQSNLTTLSNVHVLIYETLLGLHPTTLQYMPALATHWKFDYEAKVLRFRLNPKARFSDGSEVSADDVVASWEHVAGIYHRGDGSEDASWSRQDPYAEQLYGTSYEKPVAEDKYTVSVKMKEENWRLPIYFAASMKIYPARYIRAAGEDYLKGYQWRFVPGTGPYHMLPDDHVHQESYTLTRRTDYWGKDERWATGLYNFDRIRYVVVSEEALRFEKFKKGELDYYFVTRAQWWVEQTDFDKVKKGWIQKRKVYTKEPQGASGLAFNMRKPPFDDVRVRRAFAHLFNREKLMEKLFFGEYEFIDSYWPGSVYANPDNPEVRYNPRRAAQLLEEAGYKSRNADGFLVKEGSGEVLEVTLELGHPSLERIFTPVREDYENAGIKFNLKTIDGNALMKKVDERQFTLHYQPWGAILFPNPESSWGSDLADKPDNNNMPGFKNERVDRLCKEYDKEYEFSKRVTLIQQIDKIIFREYPYALGWYAPFERPMYWYRLGTPDTYFTATNRPDSDILSMWWHDPEKAKALEDAMKNDGQLPVGEVVQKPWAHLEMDTSKWKEGSQQGGGEKGENGEQK